MSIDRTVSSTRPAAVGLALSVLLFAVLGYAVLFDQGLLAGRFTETALASGGVLHEFFHDARHLLGVPCH